MSQLPIASFLKQVAKLPDRSREASGRLIFALDATASRQPTWDNACHIQSEMFLATKSLGQLQVQLCYYRGYREFHHSAWLSQQALARNMQSVQCLGGYTQIGRLLRHVLDEALIHTINAVVFVGDCVEEEVEQLCDYAGQLGLRGVPLFIFQEGQDSSASQIFSQLAILSGGAHVPFNSTSAQQLQHLLKAVAIYAVGGYKALCHYQQSVGNKHSKSLLVQLKQSHNKSVGRDD